MANAALAFDNIVDLTDTEMSASNWVLQTPPNMVIEPHVGRKWRDNSVSTYLLMSATASHSIDTIMLAGLSGENPTLRVRLSTVDATGAAGDAHDSGSISGLPYFDPDYGMFVYLLSSPVSARYARVDITEGGVEYIEAGRMFVGPRNVFGINFQTPWRRVANRSSLDVIGLGGQTFVDPRLGYWLVNARFDFLSESERDGFVESMGVDIINLGHLDMLWIRDTASNNLARDCVWGYFTDNLTVSQDLYIDPPLFGVEMTVRERL